MDADHSHACRHCHPEDFPPELPRIGEHHFAVRFGDASTPLWVYLDGEERRHCTEVIAGRDGRVVEDVEPVHRCSCGLRNVCERTRQGFVQVTTAPLGPHSCAAP